MNADHRPGRFWILLLCLFGAATPALSQTYQYESTTFNWESTNTDVVWELNNTGYPRDDDRQLVNLGFTFTFGTVDYTQVRIMSNGALQFGADTGFYRHYTNTALPITSNPPNCGGCTAGSQADRVILAYWDDLEPNSSSASSVRYQTKGSSPNRYFVVSWNAVELYGANGANNSVTVQIILRENDDIVFQYTSMGNRTRGASATIGVEIDNSDYTQYSYNQNNSATNGTALRFFKEVQLDHIRIDHPGTAVTCSAPSVTVRACANAACSAVATSPVEVTLSPSGWTGGDSFTIPANSTAGVSRSLPLTTPQTVTLGTSAVSPTPASATRCFVGATETCALTFADTGFIFSNIPTQIAGTTTSGHTLQAVRKSDNSATCTGLFTGTVNVQLASQCLNPSTCAGRQVSINGSAIASNPAASLTSYTGVDLNFGANSIASFSLAYPDVGQISLSARYALAGSGSLIGTSNSFVVRPSSFSLTAIRRNSDLATNPAASTAAGPVFIQAGEPFSATVTALTSTGVATPNFGRESPAEGVVLSANPVAGLGLVSTPVLSNATLAGTSFSSGVSTASALAWDEVGIITLTPVIADGNYLGAGNSSGPVSANIGRFIAHHFDVAATPACGAYSYSGQPFAVSIWARTRAGLLSTNHLGSNGFARAVILSNAGVSTGFSNNTVAASSFTGGPAIASPTYRFASPPQAPLSLSLRAVDSDLVSSAPPAGVEAAMPIRSGRLRLVNAYGSGQADLGVPILIESWQRLGVGLPAVYAWNTEVADTCTALSTAHFSLSGLHTAPGNPAQFALASPGAGAGTATLRAPNAAGTTDVAVNLASIAPWLQFDWTGVGTASDPTARAGFERNRGNRRQIYTREVVGGN